MLVLDWHLKPTLPIGSKHSRTLEWVQWIVFYEENAASFFRVNRTDFGQNRMKTLDKYSGGVY